MNNVPFNKPFMTGKELTYITEAHKKGHLAGDGEFTRICNTWLENNLQTRMALLTHSCTAALEMAAILAEVGPGDEVIIPSYTFVSTANAFVRQGASPVFVDIRPDTLNLDEKKIEEAITERTSAIVPVHYAGVGCEMDDIQDIAARYGLTVIEDAAQGFFSTYRGKFLGTLGDFGTLSFHETKNIISGEGGAILVNSDVHRNRAEIIREKGTNRKLFFRGEVDKYSWVDVGSSYLPSDLIAAYLWAQLEEAKEITNRRLQIWKTYHDGLAQLESEGLIRRPVIPAHCVHNAHMYYIILNSPSTRKRLINNLKTQGIQAVFHYVPLHSSAKGRQVGRSVGAMDNTDTLSGRILRLPFWLGLEPEQERIIEAIYSSLHQTLKGTHRPR